MAEKEFWNQNKRWPTSPTLAQPSYLQIDSDCEVPIQVLVKDRDYPENPSMIWSKHQKGLGELQDYAQRRKIRKREKPY